MANIVPSYLYKETRLNLESAIPGATVNIRLPTHGNSTWVSRTAQKRPLPVDIPPTEDEGAFKQRYLALAASVYHRQHHKSPRSFLWRVLEDGKVLAIRAADLSKHKGAPDAYLTLRLLFPSPIRPYCIAFSDSKDHDVLNAFILTESNHLYTLTLRPDFFVRRLSTEDNVTDWCKTYLPTAFSHKYPHRLVALNSVELIATLHDGGFLRLARKANEHGTAWEENHYNEGGWGLRSLIPFQGNNMIQHGKIHMELSAITSIAAPATIIDGTPYVFSVSLDHRLRIWNLETRKVAYNEDLLDQERLPNELGKYIIQPTHSNLIKVVQDAAGRPLAITYSPAGIGQFKFWIVTAQMDGTLQLEDIFPEIVLEAPPPTTDVWTLADFSVALDKQDPGRMSLWVLWKNNLTYRALKVDFLLNSPDGMRSAWSDDWVAVASETLPDAPLPMPSSEDAEDSTQKWLDHILYPGRFTAPTIETALALYERGMGLKVSSSRNSRNVAERICSIIGASTTLGRSQEGGMDYEAFQIAIDAQWRRFFRLVVELDKQRGEALSLCYDSENELALIANADGIAVIRDCSSMEKIWHNADNIVPDGNDGVTRLVTAAAAFSDSFPDNLHHACKTMLKAELAQDLSSANATRLRTFYHNCNFAGQISDDDYAQLIQNLGGNFRSVSQDTYSALFSALTAADESDDRLHQLPLAELGMKTTIKGVQETIELHKAICFDQLVLLAFIEGEVEQEEEGIYLETGLIFRKLLDVLWRLDLLNWLCKAQMALPLTKVERATSSPEKSPARKADESKTVTVLSGCMGHLLGLITHSGSPTSTLLTDIVIRICHPDSEYVLQPAMIQCFLLKMGRADLAEAYSVFCDQDPFSIYVQGRVFLANKDFSTAAACFKKAAFGLAHTDSKLTNDRNSSGLLDDTEWNLLYCGLPRYYSHIVSLFDKDKCHSFVTEFARTTLMFCRPLLSDPEINNLRTDALSRLFNASLQTSRFDEAYATLMLFRDTALQHASLRSLIVRMCETSSATQLLELPFLGLQDTVDAILAQRCEGILDVTVGVSYHQILYAWRIKHSDFRGAAAISLERLLRLQASGSGSQVLVEGQAQDGLETPITRQYLALINALSCVDPKQAWILSEGLPTKTSKKGKSGSVAAKRKVVTLDEIRKEYQAELDRIAAIENNQFAFAGGDEMEL